MHRAVAHRRVAERGAARRLAGAARQDVGERALGVQRHVRSERRTDGHDAVEDHAAHVLREAPQVLLRDARAVGGGVEIDAPVAERGAHALEVRDRQGGGVEGDVGAGAERGQAALRTGGDVGETGAREAGGVVRAVEPVRAAGAALVEEHDVALAADARKHRCDRGVERGGRSARAAGEHEHGIGRGAAADGGHPRHAQGDVPPGRPCRVFGHLQRAALRGQHGQPQRMLELTRGEGKPGRAARRSCEPEQRQEARDQGPGGGKRGFRSCLERGHGAGG